MRLLLKAPFRASREWGLLSAVLHGWWRLRMKTPMPNLVSVNIIKWPVCWDVRHAQYYVRSTEYVADSPAPPLDGDLSYIPSKGSSLFVGADAHPRNWIKRKSGVWGGSYYYQDKIKTKQARGQKQTGGAGVNVHVCGSPRYQIYEYLFWEMILSISPTSGHLPTSPMTRKKQVTKNASKTMSCVPRGCYTTAAGFVSIVIELL